jgi:arylsulfatase A-like enzyme
MKVVFVLFDSLNRHMLGAYGGTRIGTPNFDRLATRATSFDRHYVGSLPCMPARRDMQTGRLSFLHRSWGPLEPFDNCFPELLNDTGVYSHLVTDHFHYWEDGGATYHNRYDSYEFIRGPGGRSLEGAGAAALGAAARDVSRAAVQQSVAGLQAPQHRQPRVYQGRE